MPNTRLTKENLKNHYQYYRMAYIVVLLVAIFVGDILFAVTVYRAPNERNVEVELVCGYADTENMAPYEQKALEALTSYEIERDRAAGIDVEAQNYEPQIQSAQFILLPYDPNGEEAYYGAQKYMVTMAAQEGDVDFMAQEHAGQVGVRHLTDVNADIRIHPHEFIEDLRQDLAAAARGKA